MTRPPRCDAHDRALYRNQEAAIRAAIALFCEHPYGRLAVYWCEPERGWHVTTSSYRAALRVVGA